MQIIQQTNAKMTVKIQLINMQIVYRVNVFQCVILDIMVLMSLQMKEFVHCVALYLSMLII